jgi:hypothetical protein
MLHGLSVLVPLATLVTVSGWLSARRVFWLALLGLLLAVATTQLSSVHGPADARVADFGAPLPFARAPLDASGNLAAFPSLLRAYAVADALLWISVTILLGAVVVGLVRVGRFGGAPRPRRPLPHRVA